MTDEQYIDWLLREHCEYNEPPGFRLFMIGWMAAVSKEGLNAGEAAPMLHMAYTAGYKQSSARTWTDERPTEPGEYWLAVHPDQRARLVAPQSVTGASVRWNRSGQFFYVGWFDAHQEECGMPLDDLLLDGAKWSRRETPADPFEVTGSLEDRVAELERIVSALQEAHRPIVVGDKLRCVSKTGVLTRDWDISVGAVLVVDRIDSTDGTFKAGTVWCELADFQRATP